MVSTGLHKMGTICLLWTNNDCMAALKNVVFRDDEMIATLYKKKGIALSTLGNTRARVRRRA